MPDTPHTPQPPHRRRGLTLFLTGLPGAGKTTLATRLRDRLAARDGRPVTLLDGDDVRRRLSPDLGFSPRDRDLHIRRVGFVAREVNRHGGLVICAVVAPHEDARLAAQREIEEVGAFVLVHLATPLAVCEARDPKGMYVRARAGQLPDFTGVSAPYEAPRHPHLAIDTSGESPDETAARVLDWLDTRRYLPTW